MRTPALQGIDLDNLSNPWSASASSAVSFVVGAGAKLNTFHSDCLTLICLTGLSLAAFETGCTPAGGIAI